MGLTASPAAILASLIGESALALDIDLQRYSVDGSTPKVAVFPFTNQEVSDVLKVASREGWSVLPRGSGALTALGGIPRHVDVVLGLNRLNGPIIHSPGDMTVIVGAGVPIYTLQKALAKEGQWLPLDPPRALHRTVGGALATNLAGPLSMAYGTTRDMVLGMKVVDPNGIVTKSGGNVVKNVTGFDITKVHIGAMGTLGVIIEASLKVSPLPKKDLTVTATFEFLRDAVNAARELVGQMVAPQALEIAMSGGMKPNCVLYIRSLGTASSVDDVLEKWSVLLRHAGGWNVRHMDRNEGSEAWEWLADFGWGPAFEQGLLLRIGCLPSNTEPLAVEVTNLATRHNYELNMVISPVRGVLRCFFPGLHWDDTDITGGVVGHLRVLAGSMNGYAVVERCPVQAKTIIDVWGQIGVSLPLMIRLKQEMDPHSILNPGRFVGGI
ncbi:FAD-binding oxidoreductase [Dehalococcoidia bacterium]|nr:FAD-binding oxidoreductase [Dehalococcoidia bacterium]